MAVKEVARFFRIDFDLGKMDLAAFRRRSFGHGHTAAPQAGGAGSISAV
jgi:hypothetical protein